jgi:hypothetical protein
MGKPNLEELIALRKEEKTEEQRAHTRDRARQVEEALGPRVLAALDPGDWDINHTSAVRRFHMRGGEFHLVLTAILGVDRVDVELRHIDLRFASLAKKALLSELSEDWFLNALETLATQIQDRLTSPRNFV